jgi:hypothetical protein
MSFSSTCPEHYLTIPEYYFAHITFTGLSNGCNFMKRCDRVKLLRPRPDGFHFKGTLGVSIHPLQIFKQVQYKIS